MLVVRSLPRGAAAVPSPALSGLGGAGAVAALAQPRGTAPPE